MEQGIYYVTFSLGQKHENCYQCIIELWKEIFYVSVLEKYNTPT